MKTKYRSKILNMDPCSYCVLPIYNVDYDTYPKNRGTHRWCMTERNRLDTLRRGEAAREEMKLRWWAVRVYKARWRSKRLGYTDFTLDVKRPLPMPDYCPVLGIKLDYSMTGPVGGDPNVATIDQIKPGGGYTYENGTVVSLRANTFKSYASITERKSVV